MMKKWWQRPAVLLGGTAVILIMLIGSGIFDPKPAGDRQWQTTPGEITLPPESQRVVWLDQVTPANDYSVRLTAVHHSGELDILTGLVIGSESDNFVVIVSPLGHVATWENCVPNFCLQPSAFILPLHPWPHVRPGQNEIWLDVRNGRTIIRINREILWEGNALPTGELGVFLASYGETAVIRVTAVDLYAE